MDGESRRRKIIELLAANNQPVSGTEIARILQVSRQVIVQDIALLRAINKNILSTNKGYLLYHPAAMPLKYKRSFCVCHETDEIKEELYTIVDAGGRMIDVVVEHDIYGQITVDLLIEDRSDADEFVWKMKNCRTKPLKELADGIHYHTIEAGSLETLDHIEKILGEKGFLG